MLETISEDAGLSNSGGLQAILTGGLLAGVLDIAAACVNVWARSGRTPLWTLQSVAGGLYGARAFEGGYATAALGLLLHFLIALTAAAVFCAASRKFRSLLRRPVLSGVFYGVAVWAFMYLLVLPLTPLKIAHSFSSVLTGILIHIFFVGLPIALSMRRFAR